MIDFDMYSQMHVAETDESSPKDELGAGVFDHDEPPTAPFLLLLPGEISGYGFHDKKWRKSS